MVTVLVTREHDDHETRVAATPDTVKRLIKMGLQIRVEAGAGLSSSLPDKEYEAAGAAIVPADGPPGHGPKPI